MTYRDNEVNMASKIINSLMSTGKNETQYIRTAQFQSLTDQCLSDDGP